MVAATSERGSTLSAAPEYLSEGPVAPRSQRSIVVVAVGVVALLASSVFALVAVRADGGADSAEAAVRDLLEAAAAEDVLGVLDALLPAERDALRSGVVDLTDELRRLEILSSDVSLSRLSGIDLSFEDVDMESTSLGNDRAAVRLTGGTFSTRFDPAALPLGDFVKDLAGEGLSQAEPETDSGSIAEGDDDAVIVAVRDGGRWYVSFWYSVAEAARAGEGEPPRRGSGVAAVGAASPEDAVRDFLQAAVRLDVRRLVELMPPDEAAALHDYAPLFLADAEAGAAEARSFFEMTIDPLRLESRDTDGGSLVQVRSIGIRGVFGGMTVDYRDGCVTFGEAGAEEKVCQDDLGADLPAALEPLMKLRTSQPDLGFVTVERDGEWFVSPTRTFLDGFVATAKVFERSDLDAIAEAFGSLFGSGLVPEAVPAR